MYIVRMRGGLGNQMFQYAFLRGLESAFPGVDIRVDVTDYRYCEYHYGLELTRIFPIRLHEAEDADIERLSVRQPWRYGKFLFRVARRVARRLPKLQGVVTFPSDVSQGSKVIDEHAMSLTWERICALDPAQDYYFDGYWGDTKISQRYPAAVQADLRRAFSFSAEDLAACRGRIAEMQGRESVAVHVRRGDYVGTSFDCLPEDYYERAIAYMEQHVASPMFYFFSDDPAYVRERFRLPNMMVVEENRGTRSYRDLLLMSRCRHMICANSTFSYWGGWLNAYPGKIVIAPPWFFQDADWVTAI